MNNSRITYIDNAKAYLIFLVVVGHIMIVLNPTYDKSLLTAGHAMLSTFHMPAFFIIHGMLFNSEKWTRKSFGSYIKTRAYALLIPYLFFEGIGIVWRYIFYHQSFSDGFYHMMTIRCNVGADWFLPSIFLGSVGFWIFVKYSNQMLGIIIVLVSFILPSVMSGNQLMIVLCRGLVAFGFITVGYLGKKIFRDEKVKSLLWILLSFFITAIMAIINLKWFGNDIFAGAIHNPFTLYVGGTCGTIFILGVAQNISLKAMEVIGKHTLIIMGTHQLVIYALTYIWPSFYGGNVFMGILLFLAILIFEIPVIYGLDKYLPFLVGKGRIRRIANIKDED